jgi:hypothetical protein
MHRVAGGLQPGWHYARIEPSADASHHSSSGGTPGFTPSAERIASGSAEEDWRRIPGVARPGKFCCVINGRSRGEREEREPVGGFHEWFRFG